MRYRRNRPHSAGRIQQRGFGNIVRVGKRRFLATDRTHAHALIDAERAGLDDSLLQTPAFAARVLKIKVRIIHLVAADLGQSPGEMAFIQAKRRQQQVTGNVNALAGGHALGRGSGGAKSHEAILGAGPCPAPAPPSKPLPESC
ncbi:hypothetical protein D3C71_1581090 [compost metagenome]